MWLGFRIVIVEEEKRAPALHDLETCLKPLFNFALVI
jgi:hypothetical protein